MEKNVVIVIPAYNPNSHLENIIRDLKESGYRKIVVVNDGSKTKEIFYKIKEEVMVLNHEKNKGYGRALKTGLSYIDEHFPETLGAITVDADGQHAIEDINKVYEKFLEYPEKMIMGIRRLGKDNTPLKSRLGNKIIAQMVKKKTKKNIQDTQTGLKAIPKEYLKIFKIIEGDRYEFTIQVLIYCIKHNIEMIEVPIQTIYYDKNKTSYFKPIKDSIMIYKALKKAF